MRNTERFIMCIPCTRYSEISPARTRRPWKFEPGKRSEFGGQHRKANSQKRKLNSSMTPARSPYIQLCTHSYVTTHDDRTKRPSIPCYFNLKIQHPVDFQKIEKRPWKRHAARQMTLRKVILGNFYSTVSLKTLHEMSLMGNCAIRFDFVYTMAIFLPHLVNEGTITCNRIQPDREIQNPLSQDLHIFLHNQVDTIPFQLFAGSRYLRIWFFASLSHPRMLKLWSIIFNYWYWYTCLIKLGGMQSISLWNSRFVFLPTSKRVMYTNLGPGGSTSGCPHLTKFNSSLDQQH